MRLEEIAGMCRYEERRWTVSSEAPVSASCRAERRRCAENWRQAAERLEQIAAVVNGKEITE